MADRACDRAVLIAALIALTATLALAQHVGAPPGYYPLNYAGDAWKGELTAFDPIQHRLILTTWKCTQAQEFSGLLNAEGGGPIEHPGLGGLTSIWRVALGPSGTFLLEAGNRRVPITDVPLGASLLVFYTSRKVKGVKENEIFRIGFLPARQDLPTFVGSLVSVQGGALTFARANQRPWRGYLMPGYYVRGRDGRSYRLQPGEIPLAMPFRVIYRMEK
ncbi:MAG: hypothetical protein ACRD2H_03135 [Terriglobales bacterium]